MKQNIENIIQTQLELELKIHHEKLATYNTAFRYNYKIIEQQICGTIEQGLTRYYIELQTENKDTEYVKKMPKKPNVERLGTIMNWGFSKIIEQNRSANVILDEIVTLLNIPDIEKERKYYIEKGLDFFNKGSIDTNFYHDSKRFFDKALTYEDIDYYVLYNLGLIYFFTDEYFDIPKAGASFRKAAFYAQTEINHVRPNYHENHSQFESLINPKTIACNALIYSARAAYTLDQKEEALKIIEQVLKINPIDISALYDQMKYLIATKGVNTIQPLVNKMIEIDHFIVIKILKDFDLIERIEIQDCLTNLKAKALINAQSQLKQCLNIVNTQSPFYKELIHAKHLINKGTYLDIIDALKILN